MVFYLIGIILSVAYFIQVFFKELAKSINQKKILSNRKYTDINERKKFYVYYLGLLALSFLYLFLECPKEGAAFWVGIAIIFVFYSATKLLGVKNQFTLYDFGQSFLYNGEVYHYKDFQPQIVVKGSFLKEVKFRNMNKRLSVFKKGRNKIAEMIN